MTNIQLPDSFIKGLIVNVSVSKNGKVGTKQLKVCSVKARSITFMEVDKENRQNIFRRVERKNIVQFKPTAICEIVVMDGVLPTKWESPWDSIGQPTPMGMNQRLTPHFSNHSNGWAPKLPPVRSTTNNPVSGFPMV